MNDNKHNDNNVEDINLLQYEAYFWRRHTRTPPVVQIILQIPVPYAELQRLQKLLVIHQIQCVKNVEIQLFRRDERVVHQIDPRSSRRDVVKGIGGLQDLVDGMVHHGGRQRVVADEVRYHSVVLDDEAVDNVVLRHEPVDKVLFGKLRRQVEFA